MVHQIIKKIYLYFEYKFKYIYIYLLNSFKNMHAIFKVSKICMKNVIQFVHFSIKISDFSNCITRNTFTLYLEFFRIILSKYANAIYPKNSKDPAEFFPAYKNENENESKKPSVFINVV